MKGSVSVVVIFIMILILVISFAVFKFSITRNCIEIELEISDDMKELADELSRYIVSFGSINMSLVKDNYPEEIRRLVIQLNHIIESVNERFNLDFPVLPLDKDIADLAELGGYVLLGVNTYNLLYEASQSLPSEDESDYIVFYAYFVLFFVDLVFIQSKFSYKVAFNLTRDIFNILKFSKLADVLGWKVVGALMSIVHWRIRYLTEGSFENLEYQFIDAIKQFKGVRICIGS